MFGPTFLKSGTVIAPRRGRGAGAAPLQKKAAKQQFTSQNIFCAKILKLHKKHFPFYAKYVIMIL